MRDLTRTAELYVYAQPHLESPTPARLVATFPTTTSTAQLNRCHKTPPRAALRPSPPPSLASNPIALFIPELNATPTSRVNQPRRVSPTPPPLTSLEFRLSTAATPCSAVTSSPSSCSSSTIVDRAPVSLQRLPVDLVTTTNPRQLRPPTHATNTHNNYLRRAANAQDPLSSTPTADPSSFGSHRPHSLHCPPLQPPPAAHPSPQTRQPPPSLPRPPQPRLRPDRIKPRPPPRCDLVAPPRLQKLSTTTTTFTHHRLHQDPPQTDHQFPESLQPTADSTLQPLAATPTPPSTPVESIRAPISLTSHSPSTTRLVPSPSPSTGPPVAAPLPATSDSLGQVSA